MIKLTSYQQALQLVGQIPSLAALRIQQLEGDSGYDPDSHGHIVVLEPGDNIHDVPAFGYDPLIEYSRYVIENEQRVYEIVVAVDDEKMIGIIAVDELLPTILRGYLEAYAEKEVVTG